MNRTSDRLMLAFHWVTLLLVTATFVIGLVHAKTDAMQDLTVRAFWLDLHRSLGLAILAITLARLLTRIGFGPIRTGAELTLPLKLASRVTHFLIYACLIAMPLLGWAESSASSRHLKIFGYAFPSLVHHDSELADSFGWWHEQVGWLFLGLIALHALAALFHHYILGDETLIEMMPTPRKATR